MSSVTVVERVKKNARSSGPAAYAKVVRKYNLDTPVFVAYEGKVFRKTPEHVVSLRKHSGRHHHLPHPGPDGGVDEITAFDVENDSEYIVPVTIGTPGVELQLDFDTGSSDLWVWSTKSGNREEEAQHHIYDPEKSSTAKKVDGAAWRIGYGDGSGASGDVVIDVVKIGSIEIQNQAIETATMLSASFQTRGGSDGLLGLAWPSINTVKPTPVATPVENIINEGGKGLFSVNLSKEENGWYTFGGIDPAKAGVQESDILYTHVDSSGGFWQFPSESITIEGETVSQPGNTAILDTGTTLCILSNDTVEKIYNRIPGAKLDPEQGGYVYPSGTKLPKIEIFIGKNRYTLNEEDLNFGEVSPGVTFGGIQQRGNIGLDIFGDVVLKSIYAVFDQEGERVGAAQRSA